MNFDRFDIAEAYYALGHDFNTPGDYGWCRPNRWHEILNRLHFHARPSLHRFEDLTDNGREIYMAAVARMETSR